jgi:integrase
MKELGLMPEPRPRFDGRIFQTPQARSAAKRKHERLLYEDRKKLWRVARQHGQKYCLYHFRHTWATRALKRGVDPLTVAILMGHADPSMLAKVYQHLAHDPEFLRNAVMKATRSTEAPGEPHKQKESA